VTALVATAAGALNFGIHHYVIPTPDGVTIGRKRENVSMVADRGELCLTVVDTDGRECTVSLDLERVDSIIRSLPGLREWMVNGEQAVQ
jgi:hypothetical protein